MDDVEATGDAGESEGEHEGPEPGPEQEAAPTLTAPEQPRRLRRSRRDRVLGGVCGGLGEYLGVDPVLIRIAAVILVFAGGAGILLYVIGWIVIPEAPESMAQGMPPSGSAAPEPRPARTSGAVVLGLLFVALGVFFLVHQRWPDFLAWKYVWPLILIAVGVAIVVRARQ